MHAIYLSKYVTDEYVKGSAESSLLQQFLEKAFVLLTKTLYNFLHRNRITFFLGFKKIYILFIPS